MAERTGRALEQLVKLLYGVEAKHEGASLAIKSIESPGFVVDRDNSGRREFDVLVTGMLGKLPFRLAIECKDWSKAVDTPVVEGFDAKCNGTNIPLRMIVSREGFSEPALAKAAKLGIQCRSLKEIAGVEWLAAALFHSRTRMATSFHIFCQVEKEVPKDQFRLVDRSGELVTRENQLQAANFAFMQRPDNVAEIDGEHTTRVAVRDLGWRVVLPDGSGIDVDPVIFTIRYEVRTELIPFRIFQEKVHDGSDPKAHAVVETEVGKIIISENPDSSKGVYFVSKIISGINS